MRCTDRRVWLPLVLLALVGFAGQRGYAQATLLPVIPGAAGFGMDTRAAYGGGVAPTVYRVTNLDDRGSGSLRAALEASGPRVVIFETSGYIFLNSDIFISSPYLTVAGQTAPSPGITLRNYGLYLSSHDLLLQHFRVRPGGTTCNSGVLAYGEPGDHYNIILDHMSVSWGQDENIAFSNLRRPMDSTIWRSIISEGLHLTPGTEGCTGGGRSESHGLILDAGSRNVSVVQTLMANNVERNPYMKGDTRVALVNNVIYQWHGPWGIFFNNLDISSRPSRLPWYASVVGNRFVRGPGTTDARDPRASMFVYSNEGGSPAGNLIYRSDNTIANPDGLVIEESNFLSYNPNIDGPPEEAPLPAGLKPLPSGVVQPFVLAQAGARPGDRDAVDRRIVQEVTTRTGRLFISQPGEVGGYPNLATNRRALTLPEGLHTVRSSGYTALEEWLQAHALSVEGRVSQAAATPNAR